MKKKPSKLPKTAHRFLRSKESNGVEEFVRRFHHWLNVKHISLFELSPEDMEVFFKQPFKNVLKPKTTQAYKRKIIIYLNWLYKNGHLNFDPQCLGIQQKRPLPQDALDFLKSLEPTHKLSTRQIYETTLRIFHEWVQDSRIKLKRLNRQQIEIWFQELNNQGYHPSSRTGMLVHVRIYLRWLSEREQLKTNPDDLIRSKDFPKLPSYLPRPFPPDVDTALQKKLEGSRDPLCQSLLLMRHTGLRIGELINLEYDCVRVDHNNNRFLKVPLGKLNNERLVPITHYTYKLIKKLQANRPHNSKYLLEKVPGEHVRYHVLYKVLAKVSEGIATTEPITSHRLRHTYATSLLSGGMSLAGVMKLLGHRDFRMTLRYTAISQETVVGEYQKALKNLQCKYGKIARQAAKEEFDPVKELADIMAWLQNNIASINNQKRTARSLIKRLRRIQLELQQLMLR